jgi:hypothetical protein
LNYQRQSRPVDVVHDNGSDELETLAALKKIESEGEAIFRRERFNRVEELHLINQTVEQSLGDRNRFNPYVGTDCNIGLSVSH